MSTFRWPVRSSSTSVLKPLQPDPLDSTADVSRASPRIPTNQNTIADIVPKVEPDRERAECSGDQIRNWREVSGDRFAVQSHEAQRPHETKDVTHERDIAENQPRRDELPQGDRTSLHQPEHGGD